MQLTTSDLILCTNLLREDAKDWDQHAKEAVGDDAAIKYCHARAADRHRLADQIADEIASRDAADTHATAVTG